MSDAVDPDVAPVGAVLAVLEHAAARRAGPAADGTGPPLDEVLPVPAEEVVLQVAARSAAEVAALLRSSPLVDFLR